MQEKTVITERLTFRAKYGQGDTLVELMKETFKMMPAGDAVSARVYTDRTGTMFTVAAEIDYPDLAAYAKSAMAEGSEYADPEFQKWFARMVEVTEVGERQLLNSEKLL